MNLLSSWENFNLLVGGAAGALIGLQFVVVTLIADRPALRIAEAGAAFATPTIVHFATVLVISAAGSAPWQGTSSLSAVWGVIGGAGIVYVSFVIRHVRRQTVYAPVPEDWLFNVLLPVVSYVALVGASIEVHLHARAALFIIGAAMLLLLVVGIHNAWDAITYHVFVQRAEEVPAEPKRANRQAS